MITSARVALAQHEGELAVGLRAWALGDEGPNAVAAGRILAETIIMWRTILNSKLERF